MLNYQVVTQEDLREAAKIEKKRQYEEERKKRIFDVKNRKSGADLAQLEKQIHEKLKAKYCEEERERKYLEEEDRRRIIIKAKEAELNEDRQRRLDEVNFYRLNFQRKEDRKEFDLNDPKQYKLPVRLSDADDDKLGISSAQVFMGEDRLQERRRIQQNEQQRAWLEQQIREQKQAERARIAADKNLEEALIARGRVVQHFVNVEESNRKKMIANIKMFNKDLATYKLKQKEIAKCNEHQDNLAEIYNTLNSDLLTGNPKAAETVFGPHKKVATMFRGMSPEEKEKIKKEQLEQIEEKRMQQRQLEADNLKWEEFNKNLHTKIQQKTAELEKLKRIEFEKVQNQNYLMAMEQERKKKLEKESRTFVPTEEYFAQFNTSSR